MNLTNLPHPVLINAEGQAVQFTPTSVTQGIASLNVFADLLMYLIIELNGQIGSDEGRPTFIHVSQKSGGLVISFRMMREIFLLRDMFWEVLEKAGLIGLPGLVFDDVEVITYPNDLGPGLITWGANAAVSRTDSLKPH